MPNAKHDDPLVQTVHAVLSDFPEFKLVYLFGSLATGRAHFDSDLDIAVQAAVPLEPSERIALIEALALATGRPIDLVDLARAGEPVRGQVLRHGICLRGSDSARASLMMKHVCDMEDFMPYVNRLHKERQQRWMSN